MQEVHTQLVEMIYPFDGKSEPTGVDLQQRFIKRTRYVIKNNSIDRSIPKFYIDHVADPSLGGYVVKTTQNCIKSVMGFSRYEFEIKPQQEIEFVVDEEAFHNKKIFDSVALENFLDKQASDLLASKLIDQTTIDLIRRIINEKYIQQVLRQIIDSSITESNILMWASKKTLIPESLYEKSVSIVNTRLMLGELDKKIKSREAHIKATFENQDRIRQNIKSLEKIVRSALLDRYLADLNAEEDDLQQTRREIKIMQVEYDKKQRELEENEAVLKQEAKEFQKRIQK